MSELDCSKRDRVVDDTLLAGQVVEQDQEETLNVLKEHESRREPGDVNRDGQSEEGKDIEAFRRRLDDIERGRQGCNNSAVTPRGMWTTLASEIVEKAYKPSLFTSNCGGEVEAKNIVRILRKVIQLSETPPQRRSQLLQEISQDAARATETAQSTIPIYVSAVFQDPVASGGDAVTTVNPESLRPLWLDDVDYVVTSIEALSEDRWKPTSEGACCFVAQLVGDRLNAKGFVSKYSGSEVTAGSTREEGGSIPLVVHFTLVQSEFVLDATKVRVPVSLPDNSEAEGRRADDEERERVGDGSSRFIVLDDEPDLQYRRMSKKSSTVFAAGFPQSTRREALEDVWARDRDFEVIDVSYIHFKPHQDSRHEEKYAVLEIAGGEAEAIRFVSRYNNHEVVIQGRDRRLLFTVDKSEVDPRAKRGRGGTADNIPTSNHPEIQFTGRNRVKVFFGGLSRHVRKADLIDLWSNDLSVKFELIVMNTKGTPRTGVGIFLGTEAQARAFVEKFNGKHLRSQGEACTVQIGFKTYAQKEFWEDLDFPSSSTNQFRDEDEDHEKWDSGMKGREIASFPSFNCQEGECRVLVYGLPRSFNDRDGAIMERFLSNAARGMFAISRVVTLPFGTNLDLRIGTGTWRSQACACAFVFLKGHRETGVGFARKFVGLKGLPGHPFTVLHMEEVSPSITLPAGDDDHQNQASDRRSESGTEERTELDPQLGETKVFFWGMRNGRLAGEKKADERLIHDFLKSKGGFTNPLRVVMPHDGISRTERDMLGVGRIATLSGYVFLKGGRDTAVGFARKLDGVEFRSGTFVLRTETRRGEQGGGSRTAPREVDSTNRRRRRSRSSGADELHRERSPPTVPTVGETAYSSHAQQQPEVQVVPLPVTTLPLPTLSAWTGAAAAAAPPPPQHPTAQPPLNPQLIQQQYEAYLRTVQLMQQQQQQQ